MLKFPHHSVIIYFLAIILALSGCASSGKKEPGSADNNATSENSLKVDTPQEAIAKGEQYLAEGQQEKALYYFLQALEFDRRNTKAMEYIAALHLQRNNTLLAKQIYNEILSINNNHVNANEQLGLILLDERMIPAAKNHLAKAVTLNSNQWKSHNGLGIIADLGGRHVDAINHYQSALAVKPDNPMLLNNIGYSFYLSGDDHEAEKYFNRALSYNHKYKRAIYNLGLIRAKNKQYSSAVSFFSKVMEPYEAYNTVGYICMINNQFQQAEMYFNKAINESPFYFPKALENLETLNTLRTNRPYEQEQVDSSEIEAVLFDEPILDTEEVDIPDAEEIVIIPAANNENTEVSKTVHNSPAPVKKKLTGLLKTLENKS